MKGGVGLHLASVSPRHAELVTSRGIHAGRPALLLGLDFLASGEACEVWSEASPLPGFGQQKDDIVLATGELLGLDEDLVAHCLQQPPLEALDLVLGSTRHFLSGAARHAAEWVVIEALARVWGTGPAELLHAWLGRKSTGGWPGPRQVVLSSGVLDLSDPLLTASAARLFRDGIRTWKLKCGRDVDAELRAIGALSKLGLDARLRLDPGCAWQLEDALEFVRAVCRICELSRLTLEFVEDPTEHIAEWGPLAELAELAADEVLCERGALAAEDASSYWILKPMVHGVGGFLELSLRGAERGKQLVSSHTFDGPLALRAASELACVVQTHEKAAGLGPHVALEAWSAGGPSGGQQLRGRRLRPLELGRGTILDGGRVARVLSTLPVPTGSWASTGPAGDALSVSRSSALFGDRPFLDLGHEIVTFAELQRRLRTSLPASRADFAVIVAEPSTSAITLLLQALEQKVPALLLHPSAPTEVHDAFTARCARHAAELGREDAVIVPTSGSTATPHLVVHTRGSLLASLSASAARLGSPTPQTRWLLSLPFAHVGGLSILLRCLAAGACVVVERLPRAPSEVRALLEERQVTHLSVVPTQLRRWLQDPEFHFPSTVRCVLVGGAHAPPSLRRLAAERGAPVLYTYGLTEMGSQVATEPAEAARTAERSGVGTPLAGVVLALAEDGALRVGGPMLMRRYLGEEAHFEGGLFVTGDAGFIGESSQLIVSGRLDDLIISGGENVAPASIEAVLLDVPGVLDVCVLGRPSDEWGQEIVAAVVPDAAAPTEASLVRDLERAARERLAAFARPKTYAFFPSLPLLDSGKVDRRRLASLLTESASQSND